MQVPHLHRQRRIQENSDLNACLGSTRACGSLLRRMTALHSGTAIRNPVLPLKATAQTRAS